MKKLLLAISLGLVALFSAKAQQDPHYSQFFLNKLNYNPAFAGTEEKICALALFRTQWVGFGNDNKGLSPTTFLASVNAPLGRNFGIGLNVYRDQQGFENTINPVLSISYRYTFQDQSMLSGGIGVGFVQKNIDGSKLRAIDGGDPLIPPGSVTGYALDLGFGLYYKRPTLWRFRDFYAGLSSTHLNEGNAKYGTYSDNPMKRHYYLMTGAVYDLSGGTFALEPNLIVKRDPANTSVDINAMLMYNNKIRGGLTYRTGDAFVILLGYKFNSNMQIGYSYDLTTSDIIKYSTGSHELLFKYCFGIKTQTPPPPKPRRTPRFL